MKNKYGIIALIAILIVLIIISCLIGPKSSDKTKLSEDPSIIFTNAKKESAAVKDNEKKDFIQIDINKYMELYKDESAQSIILIARPTCQYCQIAEPIIQNIAYENNIDINYLNTDEFTEETESILVQSNELFSSGLGTPLLLIVKNSEIIDHIDGLTDKAHYEKTFKTNGYIK